MLARGRGGVELLTAASRLLVTMVVVTNNNVLEQELKIRRLDCRIRLTRCDAEEVGCANPRRDLSRIGARRLLNRSRHARRRVGDGHRRRSRAWDARRLLNRLGETSPDPSVQELSSLAPDQAPSHSWPVRLKGIRQRRHHGAACERVWKPASSSACRSASKAARASA